MVTDIELLREGGKALGLTLTSRQLEQFIKYKDFTLEVNKTMNLTSIKDDKEFIIKHFLDSLTLSKIWNFHNNDRVLDMGTGAGFPGIPLKILYPRTSFVLVDSLNKRTFIRHFSNLSYFMGFLVGIPDFLGYFVGVLLIFLIINI